VFSVNYYDIDFSNHNNCRIERTDNVQIKRNKNKQAGKRIRLSTAKFIMDIKEQIKKYITNQPEPNRSDMQALHRIILQVMPSCKLWFLNGKDSENKTVSNPNIGYGIQTIKYTGGKTRDFYQIGMSANTTGISVYILGIKDKKYLARTWKKTWQGECERILH
jgi:hypothetical protein